MNDWFHWDEGMVVHKVLRTNVAEIHGLQD